GIDRTIPPSWAGGGLPLVPQPRPPGGAARYRALPEPAGAFSEDAGKPGAPGGDDRPAGGGEDAVPPGLLHLSGRVPHHPVPGDPGAVGQARGGELMERLLGTRDTGGLVVALSLPGPGDAGP